MAKRRDKENWPAAPASTRAPQEKAEAETETWRAETGYRPNVNQAKHEPLPASRHEPRSGEQDGQPGDEPAVASPDRDQDAASHS